MGEGGRESGIPPPTHTPLPPSPLTPPPPPPPPPFLSPFSLSLTISPYLLFTPPHTPPSARSTSRHMQIRAAGGRRVAGVEAAARAAEDGGRLGSGVGAMAAGGQLGGRGGLPGSCEGCYGSLFWREGHYYGGGLL